MDELVTDQDPRERGSIGGVRRRPHGPTCTCPAGSDRSREVQRPRPQPASPAFSLCDLVMNDHNHYNFRLPILPDLRQRGGPCNAPQRRATMNEGRFTRLAMCTTDGQSERWAVRVPPDVGRFAPWVVRWIIGATLVSARPDAAEPIGVRQRNLEGRTCRASRAAGFQLTLRLSCHSWLAFWRSRVVHFVGLARDSDLLVPGQARWLAKREQEELKKW